MKRTRGIDDLLDAARNERPSTDTRRRVRKELYGRIAAGVGVATTGAAAATGIATTSVAAAAGAAGSTAAQAAATAAVATATSSGAAAKTIAVIALVSGVAGLPVSDTAREMHRPRHVYSHERSAAEQTRETTPSRSKTAASTEYAAPPPQPDAGIPLEPALPAPTVTRREIPKPPIMRPQELREEAESLTNALRLLRDARGEDAMRVLDALEARFPAGALAQERDAARVLALCAAGRTNDAAAQRERFRNRWNNPLLLSRMESECSSAGGRGAEPTDMNSSRPDEQ